MKIKELIKNLLKRKFGIKRIDAVFNHYVSEVQKFEQGQWEGSLDKAGKFIEAVVKMIWEYGGKSLPPSRGFKASIYAKKIIDETNSVTIPSEGIRLQIPRACIFVYDVTSNRGGRHDPEEVDPNEMDATCVVSICSWILAELIRFTSDKNISTAESRSLVDSLIERRYQLFEEIDGKIYVDKDKFKSFPECALLILYKLYPQKVETEKLIGHLKSNGFRKSALNMSRLKPYTHTDEDGSILLRQPGLKKAEQILKG